MWSGYLQYDMLYIHYPHSFIPFYIHLTCKINIYYGFTNSLLTNFCQVWSLKSKVRCVTNRCYWLSSNIYKTGHYKNFMASEHCLLCWIISNFICLMTIDNLCTLYNKYHFNQYQSKLVPTADSFEKRDNSHM